MDSKFKSTSLEEMIDKHIDKIGTPKRDSYENELRLDLYDYPQNVLITPLFKAEVHDEFPRRL